MKTEKQKMLDGDLYFSFGEELFNERQFAKEIIFDFNNLRPQEVEKRNELLKKLLGSYGEKFFIEPPFRCDYGYNISIGENFYSNYNLVILDCARVTIGDNVLIGPNVNLFAAGHPVDVDLRLKEFEYAFPINIGNNVWIGGGVTINAGVNIGDGTVIASGSVVTKDIPANVVAGGNPCKVIRKIDENDKRRYFKDRYID
ncbi:sugar O-acetyltransferase [Clostridium mediterraneense]|uniref:sugar O-acetyltransferase n=1 Tax=Clostridium mediterraneense TaxID=1805472 RepID=UPI00082EA1D8|nr:sugar O-acetyltransferase [Clostridium mediterraneense]